MSNPRSTALEQEQKELEVRLRELDERMRNEMRARGFDPAQDANLALTGPLAKLYMERETLREELETLRCGRKLDGRVRLIMTEIERIIDQLNRAFVGEAWHGPAVIEILEGITAQQAAAHPLAGGHSIWELTLHITAWTRAGSRRLQGDRAQLTDVENFPPVTDSGERAWDEARESINLAYQELRGAILLLDDSQLDQPIIEGMSSIYVTLHGVIQHSLYHAGQIAILKKAFSEGQTK
jgi:uncharacterized damage-inducible protein DinB